MDKVFLSEYVSDSNRRSAQVFKVKDQAAFVVDCYDCEDIVKSEVVGRERTAEDIADDWCKGEEPCQDEE